MNRNAIEFKYKHLVTTEPSYPWQTVQHFWCLSEEGIAHACEWFRVRGYTNVNIQRNAR